MCWVAKGYVQVHRSLKSDRFAGRSAGQETMGKPMPADDLMDDFPPAPDRLVTLSNWRKAPFSAWGFRNVRRLIPTADIAAGGDTAGAPKSPGEDGDVLLPRPAREPPP